MDRSIKMNSKSSSKKEAENKAKEEEDILFESNINFEITQLKPNEILNMLVKELTIGGATIKDYDSYNYNIEKLLSQYKESLTELDYRFNKLCEKDEILPDINTSNIDKMRVIGKIGEGCTMFDQLSLHGDINFTNNKFKLESKNGFGSLRTNNCVFKGKWYYEVEILTNGLQQIGWCQLNTPFTSTEGVGDDETSFGYDGYRLVLWHKKKTEYGNIWDIGDIIGCCIDLDCKKLEFFKNGISLGIALENIPVGENIAYFPGVSLSQEEKDLFNFGNSPFQYSYPGYEPFDLADSSFNGTCEITHSIIDLLKNSLLKILSLKDLLPYHKICLTNKIFNFFVQVSFNDIFTLKTLIIPFLYEISTLDLEQFEKFFKHILIYFKNKKEKIDFIKLFFDNLCAMIEENALKGERGIDDWKKLITIFYIIFKIDFLVELWIEAGNYIENLKCIFNSNIFKMQEFYDYIKAKYDNFNTDISAYKVFKESKNEYYEQFLVKYDKLEGIYSTNLKLIILLFLQDTRTFKIKSNDQENLIKLKTLLVDYVNKGYDYTGIGNILFEAFGSNKKDNIGFYKNFIFNLYSILGDYFSLSLDNFDIEVWFNRLQQGNLYYDEIGIGGTISHVTSEYISQIEEFYRIKNGSFHSELNHRIAKISFVLVSHLREFTRHLDKFKNVRLKQIISFENGTNAFNKLFRGYFYLYTEQNQILLYKYAFFLIKWINTLIRKNKNLVYFIPKSLFDTPFDIFKFLNKIKSKVLLNPVKRKEVNSTCPHFVNDDFVFEIVFFYTTLFGDSQIANPELKESLILRIKHFMKKKEISKIYEENSELTENLIKGLLEYMSIESLCHISCEIMVKIVKPICFGNTNFDIEKVNLVKIAKRFFENNTKSFHEFMDNYSNLINRVMTEYAIELNECSSKILIPSNQLNQDFLEVKTSLLKKLIFSYTLLCDLMKIFEFLLAAYPNEFFDVSTLNYSRFVNFLKNTSSRLLEKPYISNLMNLLEKSKPNNNFPGGKESLLFMAYSIIGIILNIEVNKDNPKFQEFINKVSNLSDLHMEPFEDLYNIVIDLNPKMDNKLKDGLKKYFSIIEFFLSNKEKKRERKMSTEDWEETNKNENICIICLSNNSDRILIPCKHVCCNECLLQYLSDKKNCFICNALIETTEIYNK